MNSYAYRTAGLAIKTLTNMSRAKFRIHGEALIPKGSLIFVVNHFTRMETIFLPYYINRLTRRTIWSLADYNLFAGGLGTLLNRLGAVSTRNPDRDLLIVKTLLTNEASWIIFPEGRMVKNKKVYDAEGRAGDQFMIVSAEGTHPPHTGAATFALRAEFYRERLRRMLQTAPDEAQRLKEMFRMDDLSPVLKNETWIVPVNLTYYPLRARENNLNRLAELFIGEMTERAAEEIMTEGSMLLSGVDVDIRFGEPIRIANYIKSRAVQADIATPEPINFDDPIASRNMLRKTARKIMERYMTSIYRLTTVNHDHILATLIRYMPGKQIDEQELRRRAYLAAATLDFHKMGIFRHESLSMNQISLLTDDRFDKITNFIEFAKQREVLVENEGVLVKTVDLSETPESEFHQVRIENPVVVAANEVEPLSLLQKSLKLLALQPNTRVRNQLWRCLVEKADLDFEKDYAGFEIPGESKDREVGRPFLIKGGSRELGIVLVHGYMAAPLEVRALAEHLARIGCWIYVPRLKGHGTSPEDLAGRRHMEWIDSVAEGYVIMKTLCRRVIAGGFSFGAGMALDLCTRVDDLSGVFAISPPMKLQDFSAHLIPAVNFWNKLMKKINYESAGKQFIENKPENPHINYSRNPLSGVMEMERLMNQLEDKISRITIPALIIQSYADPVVDPDASLRIFKTISSKDKEYLLVSTNRHSILNGDESKRIFVAVENFVRKMLNEQSEKLNNVN